MFAQLEHGLELQVLLEDRFRFDHPAKHRLAFAFELGILSRRFLQRDVQLVRDHPRDPVRIAIRQTHYAPDVPHHAFRLQFSEGNDLRDAAFAIFLPHVLENFAAACFAEINIDVGRRHAIGVEEALEE